MHLMQGAARATNEWKIKMKRILLPFSILMIALWAMAQPADILDFSAPFLKMREAYTVLLGFLALGWMAFVMLLALHPFWLERALGGLDRLYQAHKWSGIGATVLVVAHWLLILSPRTVFSLGLAVAPAGGRPPHGPRDPLLGLARESGEWAAWLMLVLLVVALLRFLPYRWFRQAHKGFPVVFLIGAFHSVVLSKDMLLTPLGGLICVVSVFGSVVSVISLLGFLGRWRRLSGEVAQVATQVNGMVEVHIRPDARWPGHQAGQFALLTLDAKEGPHPFTIASHWQEGALLRFCIKPLGDYTRSLAGRIKPGQVVQLEGPFGGFDFAAPQQRQIWVAGGIGLTPFMARLEALAAQGGNSGPIDLFYCARTEAEAAYPAELAGLCERAGVKLHLRVSERQGRLRTQEVAAVGPMQEACVWFCGAEHWGKQLHQELRQQYGLPAGRFNQEAFNFR